MSGLFLISLVIILSIVKVMSNLQEHFKCMFRSTYAKTLLSLMKYSSKDKVKFSRIKVYYKLRTDKKKLSGKKFFFKKLYKFLMFIPMPFNMVCSYWGQNCFERAPYTPVLLSLIIITLIYVFVYIMNDE